MTNSIITPNGSAIICGYTTTTMLSAHAYDTTTGFVRYSVSTGKPAGVLGVFQFRGHIAQPGLRATTTSVSPGQSQKMPSAERFASSARTSAAKSSRRSPNRCGAEDDRER